jgi:hypothetical protein
MFYNVVKEYTNIIVDYSVSRFEKFGSAVTLVAQIEFTDHSVLHIKDYLFVDGTRKYSYHWQDAYGQLRARWDNSPHHNHVVTFPHHKHEPGKVSPSYERNLRDILEVIRQAL